MTERNKFTPLQEQWLTALESGEYKQCTEYLRKGNSFCCLGLATKIAAPYSPAITLDGDQFSRGHSDGDQTAPPVTVNRMMFKCEYGGSLSANLANRNDERHTFAEIAAFVRKQPWRVFTNFDRPAP